MAKQLRYLSDNFDYMVSNDELLVQKNKLFNTSNLFWFHTIFENYGAMTTLSATLRAMKVKMPDGTTKSMWDLYKKDKDGIWKYTGPVRGILQDALGNTTELKELSLEEVERTRSIYERMHGSYRQDEAMALQLSVLGQ